MRTVSTSCLQAVVLLGFAWLSFGCAHSDPSHDYIFPSGRSGLFVLVNHVKGIDTPLSSRNRRQFDFGLNGICLADVEEFSTSKTDSFYLREGKVLTSFNPNDPSPQAWRVCGVSASLGSGYNEAYYREKFGLKAKPKDGDESKTFDFYFFVLGSNCDSAEADRDAMFEEVARVIEEGGYDSSHKGTSGP